jgi:thioredoxin 1
VAAVQDTSSSENIGGAEEKGFRAVTGNYLRLRAIDEFMRPQAKRTILLLLLAVFAVAMAGCAGSRGTADSGKMGEIDAALRNGPVFVEFGAPWCHWCDEEKLIVGALSPDYGNVSFVDVDVDVNGTLADEFYVEGIPEIVIIVRKNPDGSYLYIDSRGKVTADRSQARIVGFRERDELKPLLDAAVAAR